MKPRTKRQRPWLTIVLAAFILVPAFLGFGTKLREFIILYWGDHEGAFTLMPLLNYLLASVGFFFLFCWALMHGMFRDIEKPKYTMLDQEHELDAEEESEAEYAEWN